MLVIQRPTVEAIDEEEGNLQRFALVGAALQTDDALGPRLVPGVHLDVAGHQTQDNGILVAGEVG